MPVTLTLDLFAIAIRYSCLWPPGHIYFHPVVSSSFLWPPYVHLLSSNISSTCPHNMVNFGPLAAEIVSLVWDTPANFNGFRVLAALLHGTLVVGVSQTAALWTEGATYIRQGGHHVGHWPTFLVKTLLLADSSVRNLNAKLPLKISHTVSETCCYTTLWNIHVQNSSCATHENDKQVISVICKDESPPHTDCSIVFAR